MVNIVMFLTVAAAACFAALVWFEPDAADKLSRILGARAAALRAARDAYRSAYRRAMECASNDSYRSTL